jgi:hypothetical protein
MSVILLPSTFRFRSSLVANLPTPRKLNNHAGQLDIYLTVHRSRTPLFVYMHCANLLVCPPHYNNHRPDEAGLAAMMTREDSQEPKIQIVILVKLASSAYQMALFIFSWLWVEKIMMRYDYQYNNELSNVHRLRLNSNWVQVSRENSESFDHAVNILLITLSSRTSSTQRVVFGMGYENLWLIFRSYYLLNIVGETYNIVLN